MFRSRRLSNDDINAVTNRTNRTKLCDFEILALEPSLRLTTSHNWRIKKGESVDPPTKKAQNEGKLSRRIVLVNERESWEHVCEPSN